MDRNKPINILISLLYGVLTMETLFLLYKGLFYETILFILTIIFALVIRLVNTQRTSPWKELREELTEILVHTGALPEGDQDLDVSLDPSYLVDSFKNEGEALEFISSLRKIGIDGVLILLLLAKYREKFASVKAIKERLEVPMSSLYRVIERIHNMGYISSKSVIENPSKRYYQITPRGEDVLIDLYEYLPLRH